jgi:diguanylate cyclase (GGDEF)-like protein
MTIVVGVVLIAAAVLQLVAVALAVRALPHSGPYRYLWIALSLALLLMVQRRIDALMDLPEVPHGAGDAFLAFAISALMAFSMAGLARMLVALRHSQDELTRLATTDALTGLASRRHLLAELERELQRAARSARPVGVLMIDIDRFKAINDSLGHANGDAVLVALASRIRLVLRAIDTCGRIGGEEFVVVLPDTDLEGALRTGERLREAMAGAPVLTASGPVAVTISLGVAVHEPAARLPDAPAGPTMVDVAHALLQRADEALYRAKSLGRNRVEAESPGSLSPPGERHRVAL